MPFYDRIATALGLQQPKAYNRFTREPIVFSDNVGNGNIGAFDFLTKVMEVDPNHPDAAGTMRHETAHSLFNQANPSSAPMKILNSFFGSNVSPIISNLQKQAPLEKLRSIKPQEFEHLVISALEGEQPEIVEDGIRKAIGVGNISSGHILDAIKNLPVNTEEERKTVDKLTQVFNKRRK